MGVKEWIDQRFYPTYQDRWDDYLFRKEILDRLDPGHTLLDLGAGAGIASFMDFRGQVANVCGVDPDPRVLENPLLGEAKIGTGEALPYADAQFDIVITNSVLEHLSHPKEVFREVSRVLKPGGLFLAKTPNKWHYVTLISRMTPHWFHTKYNSLRGVVQEDVFPTFYRANTSCDLGALAKQSDLEMLKCSLIEGRPEYLRVLWPAYLFGVLYERLVNRFDFLQFMRVVIIASFRRK